jgi:general secretion pathway protein F/type IV pilus assembly protein PilC
LIFRYVGYDKSGNKVKARLEANSLEEAKKKLKSKGIIYESIKEVKRSFLDNIDFNSSSKIPADKLSQLTKNLAIYLKSGIPILKVIKLAKSQYEEEPKIYDFLTTVETSIDEGNSFYHALENQKILELPAFFKQSIKVAEESGTLSEVMFEMSRFIAEQDKVKKKVKQAMVYPSFIVILSVFMVAFMLTTIVPKITSMFTQLNQELPTITQIVIKAGDFLGEYWLYMAIFIMIVSGVISFLLKTNKSFKYFWDGMLLKLPLFGKIIKTFELARFSYISSVLSKSGVTFIQAIKFASNVLDNSVMKKEFVDSASDVVEGKKFSTSIAKYGKHIDKSFIQAIALAEETSEVPAVMQNMAELYFEENKNKIDLFLSLLEPMLILFVGVTIGVIVVAMLLPIFSMDMVNM